MDVRPVYIWFNEKTKKVSWMTPAAYGECLFELKPSTTLCEQMTFCRNGDESIALIDCVGKPLATLIETWLSERQEQQIIRLYLCANLPETWQTLALEWARIKGQPLYRHLHVLRYVPFYPENIVVNTQEPALFINLWPKPKIDDKAAPLYAYLISLIRQPKHYRILTGEKKSQLYLEQNDSSQHDFLCVISHGSENKQRKPFFVANQRDWELPERQLPPLVLLLACGSEDGNLVTYAQTLLKRGAKTVLAPVGKLDASQVELFLKLFLQQWQDGKAVHNILYQLQQDKKLTHAALRIRLIGQGDLYRHHTIKHTKKHTKEKNSVTTLSWKQLQQTLLTSDDNLVSFLNQLTYRSLMQDGSLEKTIAKLYDAFCLLYNDPYEDDCLYQRLSRICALCWPITQHWINYFLVFLSSLHDHQKMEYYQRKLKPNAVHLPQENLFAYYLMHGFYRKGKYVRATKAFVASLNNIEQSINTKNSTRFKEAEYKIIALSINIFIDMNLPSLGLALLDHTHYCLEEANLSYDIQKNAEFTLLDQEARLIARKGGFVFLDEGIKKAMMKLERKRELAQQEGHDGQRELASLLSLATWLEQADSHYAETVMTLVDDVEMVSEEIYQASGNCTVLYLLRALASWAWHQNDKTALKIVEKYLPVYSKVSKNKHLADSGPIGFIIAYLALADNKQAQQLWPSLASKLESDAYHFELAIFYALLGNTEESRRNYRRFTRQQQRLLKELAELQYYGFLDDEFYAEYKMINQYFTENKAEEYRMLEKLSHSRDTSELIELGLLPF